MTDGNEPVVLAALGLDPDTDYPMPDHLFEAALAVALDPDTPAVDPSSVPIMDDHGTVPDADDSDHAAGVHHAVDTADHLPGDHDVVLGDEDLHLDPGGHDTGDIHHDDGSGHDPGHDDGSHDTDWHI